jgi:putative ABC transport system substrate-binding protein
MHRTLLTVTSVAAIAAFAFAAFAQAPAPDRTLRIAILSSGELENRSPLDAAFVEGLRQQGYVEGKNLVIDRRYDSGRMPENARALAGMHFDAILTTCTPSTRMMKEATSSTPIVMLAVSDPVRQHIIESYARPGQNVTGTSSQAEDLLAKRLELVAATVPKATTILVLANATNPVHALSWDRLESGARVMNLKLVKVEVRKTAEVGAAVDAAMAEKPGALFVMPDDPLMYNARPVIVAAAARNHLPDFHWARQYVEVGGLMSYGESLTESYRSAAGYISKIKGGANPGLMPVVQPTRFELVINLKTANALGITIPPSVLTLADEVIR